MGIVQYRLRDTAGGQPTSVAEKIEKAVVNDPQAVRKPVSPVVAGEAFDTAATLPPVDGRRAINSGSEEPVADQVAAEINEQDQTALAFRLACWRPSEDLLVLDWWPPGLGADPQRLQLLANILQAIQRGLDPLPAPEFVDWPLGGNVSRPAAQAHITMFLRGRFEKSPFRYLLALGSDTRDLLGSHDAEGGVKDGVEETDRPIKGFEMICTHSLGEMLDDPHCKKNVWAAIRKLGNCRGTSH